MPLHSCMNCQHFVSRGSVRCLVPEADDVLDPGSGNRCSFFEFEAGSGRGPAENEAAASARSTAPSDAAAARKKWAELHEATGGKVDQGWGTQIRSYVIYDNRVKDHRTGFEIGNPQTVLDGALDGFIDSELKRRRSERA